MEGTMALSWNKNLETGINIVDSQHKELVENLNKFFDACMEKRGKEELINMIKFLEKYIVFHFKTEEDIMQRHNFPGYSFHRSKHEEFIKSFTEIKRRFETEGATLEITTNTTRFLSDWLIKHISKIDKQLSSIK